MDHGWQGSEGRRAVRETDPGTDDGMCNTSTSRYESVRKGLAVADRQAQGSSTTGMGEKRESSSSGTGRSLRRVAYSQGLQMKLRRAKPPVVAAYYSPYQPCYYYISSFYGNIPRARHGLARSLISSLSLLCGYVSTPSPTPSTTTRSGYSQLRPMDGSGTRALV